MKMPQVLVPVGFVISVIVLREKYTNKLTTILIYFCSRLLGKVVLATLKFKRFDCYVSEFLVLFCLL
jgi:hypothetical protein